MRVSELKTDISIKEWLYAYLLLCLSGNPFFPEIFSEWIYIGFAIAIYLLNRNKLFVDKAIRYRFFKWIIGFTILFFAQYLVVSPVSIPANINFLAKFSIAFMIPCVLGEKFRYAYFRAITFTAAVSLVFFALYYFFGWYTGMSFGREHSILIYNQLIGDEPRNSGMFWEAGAFQGYINLVPVLFFQDLKQLWKQERLSCIILILALITTFSTTGYIVLMFILGAAFIKQTHNYFMKGLVGIIASFAVIFAFTSFDFLGEKIQEQLDTAATIEYGEVSWSRFGAAIVDSYEIARSPLTGNGFMMDARYPKLGDLMAGSGNGFTGAINVFGIIVIFIYLVQLFKQAPGKDAFNKVIYVLAIVLMLQGEFFLNYPMFWALLFIRFPKSNSN